MQTDDELYQAFLQGDISAMDTLALRHRVHLMTYLNTILHSHEDAEDMTMEAFARIMAKRPNITAGSFRAYLYQTARHLAFRFMRKYRLEHTGLDELEIPEYRTAEDTVREALWLIYFENMSYMQAAKIMRVTNKKIDNLLTKGKRLLRAELEKEGITDAE